jgi:xylulokinase
VLIAHDLGTSGDKASLYDLDGTLVTSVTESYPTAYGPATRSEQDPEHWWRAVVSGTRRLLAASGTAPTAVTGICVGGTMMAVVCLDAAGTVLRPAMIWSDQRAAAQADRLRADVGDDHGYTVTGNRLAATYTLPKLMWLTEHEPDVVARTYRAVGHKDVVNARLTGIIATDVTDASSTAAYDLREGSWSDELVTASGIESRLLPLVVPSTSILGPLTRAAAAELGLTTSTVVVAGGGDGPMAAPVRPRPTRLNCPAPPPGTRAPPRPRCWTRCAARSPCPTWSRPGPHRHAGRHAEGSGAASPGIIETWSTRG